MVDIKTMSDELAKIRKLNSVQSMMLAAVINAEARDRQTEAMDRQTEAMYKISGHIVP